MGALRLPATLGASLATPATLNAEKCPGNALDTGFMAIKGWMAALGAAVFVESAPRCARDRRLAHGDRARSSGNVEAKPLILLDRADDDAAAASAGWDPRAPRLAPEPARHSASAPFAANGVSILIAFSGPHENRSRTGSGVRAATEAR